MAGLGLRPKCDVRDGSSQRLVLRDLPPALRELGSAGG
jgi:hypothetical protein